MAIITPKRLIKNYKNIKLVIQYNI